MRSCLAALFFCLSLAQGNEAKGQEVTSDGPKESGGHRYFSKPVDFWKSGASLAPAHRAHEASEPAPERVAVRDNVWAQPVRTADGSWMIYVPPRQVLDFLESPTEETARAYLTWKAGQTEKLRKAMVLLAKIKDSGPPEAANASSDENRAAMPAPQDLRFKITYFKKPSCPHCVSQDGVLSGWLERRTLGQLDVVQPGERPELWKAYQVRGTPTLVLEVEDQSRKAVLVGLQSAQALEAALANLAIPASESYSERRKETAR
jgi:hypothetical protein